MVTGFGQAPVHEKGYWCLNPKHNYAVGGPPDAFVIN